MGRLAWFANRALAGITTAALTGTIAALVMAVYVFLSPGTKYGPDANPWGGTLWMLEMGVIFAVIGGSLSGILVMCLSKAKERPWAALPKLLVGTTLGVIVAGLPFMFMQGTMTTSILGIIGFVAGPTIGGVVASSFIRRSDAN